MSVGSTYKSRRFEFAKKPASLADLGVTDEDAPVYPYEVDVWDMEDFVEAWLANQDRKVWKDFYLGMAASCYEATGSIVPPLKLQARLRTCARHLVDQGAKAPAFPDRPEAGKTTISDVLNGRLGAMLKGSVG